MPAACAAGVSGSQTVLAPAIGVVTGTANVTGMLMTGTATITAPAVTATGTTGTASVAFHITALPEVILAQVGHRRLSLVSWRLSHSTEANIATRFRRCHSARLLQLVWHAGVAGTTGIGTTATTGTGKIATGATVGTGTLGVTTAGMSGSDTIGGAGRGITIDC